IFQLRSWFGIGRVIHSETFGWMRVDGVEVSDMENPEGVVK
ncbi:hypothetical protein TNCV_4607531, partial [Trichonephila clavipes]